MDKSWISNNSVTQEEYIRDINMEDVDRETFINEHNVQQYEVGDNSDKFFKLLKEAEQNLYPGCKFTKLSFIVHLYHLKCLNGWTDKSFSMLLELLCDAFPKENTLPKSFYETKKIISGLGLSYEKIHVCPNECILYWKDLAHANVCPTCGISRWKVNSDDVEGRKKIPAKVLRWFPLKSRLQRLFMSSKTASSMTWHEDSRTRDGLMRHPADSFAWKDFDHRYPDFSSDPRNVRLGLASDGFNPFKTMTISHSTWPVVLIPYNLPPWMCMKQPNFILSLLIPGPKGPGNNIDVYMQPLVEELKELWEIGVKTFDACKKESFQMRAAIMWTINDFPAYANLSGWSTKGRYACPCCGFDTASKWLRYSKKFSYMCHRRWLEPDHKWRNNRGHFDGDQEFRAPPKVPNGSTALRQLKNRENKVLSPWKKKSIFFSLPYWEYNVLRHNLDVMHIEKNVCDNIVGTLLNLERKSKDNDKARYDLIHMNIRSQLHPRMHQSNGRKYLPRACYQMTSNEKESFLEVLKNMKSSDECVSSIPRCVQVKQRKIFGLKSYDCHLLMQEFLPIAMKGCLPNKVSKVISDLCRFFKELCGKVLSEHNLEHLEKRIAKTLCQLEKIFPPSFFTIMVHLVIHLAYEAKIGGPVHYRWMYPIERFLFTLKSFVRNRARPEGSIAEGYLANECLIFCSRYLSTVETRFTRPCRNDDSSFVENANVFNPRGRPLGRKNHVGFTVKKRKRVSRVSLDKKTLLQAHRYVLFNNTNVDPFQREHIDFIKRRNQNRRLSPYEIDKIHSRTFPDWFCERVARLEEQGSVIVTDEIRWLARGPLEKVRNYSGYIVNGVRFHTKKRERCLKTQNSGICVTVKTKSYASTRDKRPKEGEINYYGALIDIIQLDYAGKYKVVLFKCDWVDINKGCNIDDLGLTLVNFNYLQHTGNEICDDPFIFASQAKKVFYVENKRLNDWFVVVHAKVRDVYDMGDAQSNDIDKSNEQVLEEINDDDLIRPETDDSDDIIEVIINIEDIPQNDDENEDTEDESEEDLSY
ncbi:uncharacterized protein LOC131661866 isoform X2 [Vicia villosa]|uniref:uncharacterized protein LOC131661866 isoform X2 n=1 Tax=Vicia villosa TaxID=3911 RepID=UPI00273BC9A3|nr:uncharacterized protein LOC131661866 isoform X2 [Vicia villosa]